jgi:hypothetical protein
MLRRHLQQEPMIWLRRTVHMRAVAVQQCQVWLVGPGTPCLNQEPVLIDANNPTLSASLPLAVAPPPPLLARLRGLPIIGRIVPPTHLLRWNTPADYVLRIHTVTSTAGSPLPSYQALLQDVTL